MNDNQKWEDPLENDGITLGPEEALQREIEKSKSLPKKVREPPFKYFFLPDRDDKIQT